MNRPVLWVAVFLLAGTYCAAVGAVPGLIGPIAIFGLGIVLIPLRRKRYSSAIGIFLCLFAAGALQWNARHRAPPGDELSWIVDGLPGDTPFGLEGRVTRADVLLPGQDYMSLWIKTERAGTENESLSPLRGGVVVRWSDPDQAPRVGDRVRVSGPLSTELGPVNPGTRNAEDYFHRHGIHSSMRLRGAGAVTHLQSGPLWSPGMWASRLRSAQANRLARVVPKSTLPFVLTVWLGERRTIDSDSYAAFLESGTAHILAVSGIHTGIIYITVTVLLKLVMGRRRRRLQVLLTMAAVLAFALTAGARVTSMRAAAMIVLYLVAELFDREPDAPTALSVAAILFTLSNPDLLFDTAFRLSFLSVASLLLFSDPIKGLLEKLPGPSDMLLSPTLAVQILPLPVAVASFHVLPTIAPLTNLIVIPLLSIVLWLCMITSFFAFLLPPVAPLFGHAIDPFVFFIRSIADLGSDFASGHVYLTRPTGIAMGAYWLCVALIPLAIRARKHRRGLIAAALSAAVGTVLFWSPLRHQAELTVLDVRNGDAIFVRTPAGATLLVDGGERNPFNDAGKRIVAPFLWSNHVSRIDAVLATHPDHDHIGGLHYILDKFRVGTLYLGPDLVADPQEDEIISLCEERGVPVRRIGRGDEIDLPGAQIEVLHPPADWPDSDSDNSRSVVIRVTINGVRALLTGDVESKVESLLLQHDLSAEILKVPHHGSKTSSIPAFVEAVRPEYAVISTGRNRGRPIQNAAVIQRYENAGAQTFTTDISGGIRFRFDDGDLSVETSRETP